MSIIPAEQLPEANTSDEWQRLGRLHAQIQERTNRYVEQLSHTKSYLQQYVAVLTAMLDSVGDGLIVCDAAGNLSLINDAAAKLVGDDMPTRVGGAWPNNYGLFYPDSFTVIEEKDEPMRQALQGRTIETIFFAKASNFPDGRWFRVHATPVCDKTGTLHGAIAVFHDITDTQKASRQRDALSALVTHDLKNHLVGESRLLQLLIDERLGPLNEQQKDILRQIDEDSKRQLQMTKSLVEIFRYDMQSEVLQFQAANVISIIEACLNDLLPSMQTNGLTLETDFHDQLHSVSVDGKAIRHVMMNILGNAIKFTPQGGRIVVATRNHENEISIAVSDSGAGIPEADLRLLFANTWTGSAHHRNTPDSTGLGLYLCAKIMTAHNGRITCSSKQQMGSTFTLFLPALQAQN